MYTTLALVNFLATSVGCDQSCVDAGNKFSDMLHNGISNPIIDGIKYLLVVVIVFGFAKRMGDHRESAIMHIVEAGAMIALVMIAVPLLKSII